MSQADNPYASPQEASAAPVGTYRRDVIPFASGHFRAMCAVVMLSLGILANIGLFASSLAQYHLLEGAQHGRLVTAEAAEVNDNRQRTLAVCELAVYVLTAIAFLCWVHRAHRNLPALGMTHLEFSPAGAVGWYFCPIANYFKPYMAMRELACSSDPERSGFNDAEYRAGRNPAVVPWWWAAFVAMGLCGYLLRFNENPKGLDDALNLTRILLVDMVISVVAGVLAILVVMGIDARQDERYRRICENPTLIAPDAATAPAYVDDFLNSLE